MSDSLDKLGRLSKEFHLKCLQRLEEGEEQYGALRFLDADRDLFEMISEELFDIANYAEMLYMRLQLVKERLYESGDNLADSIAGKSEHGLSSGSASFVKSSEVSSFLPKSDR